LKFVSRDIRLTKKKGLIEPLIDLEKGASGISVKPFSWVCDSMHSEQKVNGNITFSEHLVPDEEYTP
jgi:hypothetical protein